MSRRFGPLVLCYHAVSSTWQHALAVSPTELERQLRLALRLGWKPAPAAEIVAGRGRLLHVTFDDAYRSVADALPLLDRHGIRATVFACPGYADAGAPLTVPELAHEDPAELATMDWDGLRALAERGLEIGSHTVSHPHLTRLGDAELERELRQSRERLQDELGRPCPYVAYPYGDADARVHAAARAAGYDAGFGLPGRRDERFGLPRVGVYRRDRPAGYALKILALSAR